MLDRSTPVIVGARRTPIGTAGHALRDVPLEGLAAPVLRSLVAELEIADIAPTPVGQVVLGNCMGPGGNTARLVALAAGLPVSTPGMTVDVQCGSGLAAITTACSMIRGGLGGSVLAGGVESASTAPWRLWPPASEGAPPRRYSRAPFAPMELGDPEMGAAADALARIAGITRERQDRYAGRSHERAASAWQRGDFTAELVELPGLDRDERVRPGLSATKLARLRPAFAEGGTVTVGNSCGINDGAAAVTLIAAARRHPSGRLGRPRRDEGRELD